MAVSASLKVGDNVVYKQNGIEYLGMVISKYAISDAIAIYQVDVHALGKVISIDSSTAADDSLTKLS